MTPEEIEQQKELSYFQAILDAYTENSFEKDRSLLTLSSGAIGLLVTLLTTVGVSSIEELIIYTLSFVSFGACIVLLLHIYKINQGFLLQIVKKENIDERKLLFLDKFVFGLFLTGIILFFSIGVVSGINQLTLKEKNAMSDELNTPKRIDESLNGLQKIQPDSAVNKSLQGFDQLNPSTSSSQSSQSSSTNNSVNSSSINTDKSDKKDQ